MSSGERKRMMVKPWSRVYPAGVAVVGLWGIVVPVAAVAGRSEKACW